MSEEASKEHFEWYAKVAEEKLKELKEKENLDIFQDCKTREVFSNYMLNVFIQYYGLRCSCHQWMDWDFYQCGGHYHHCQLYQFSYIINRCLDWAEKHYTKPAETDLSSGLSSPKDDKIIASEYLGLKP